MKIRGIYKIQSIIKPERIYIGSSENIYSRWSSHRRYLHYNKHASKKMQYHYNKYGSNDLSFEILEECSLENKLIREQYYIDLFKPFFNTNSIAGNTTGRVFSEETLFKLRNPSEETLLKMKNAKIGKIYPKRPYPSKLKGIPKSKSHVDKLILASNGIPILQYDLDNNFIKEWHGIRTAAKAMNINHTGIMRCLSGRYKQSYGFIWKYK